MHNKKFLSLLGVLIILIGTIAYFFYTESVLDKRMRLAADHLSQIQNEDGSFIYFIDYKNGHKIDIGNIVRQAGAGYGLAEYYRLTQDPKIAETIQKALKNYAAWSVGNENAKLVKGPTDEYTPRAGTTALALLTALYYQETCGSTAYAHLRDQWKNGLLSLYVPGEGIAIAPDTTRQSPYFDGEGWLALATYHRLFPEDKSVNDVLIPLENYLLSHYAQNYNKSFFHWGTMAASERYRQTQDPKFKEFALAQYNTFMDHLKSKKVHCYAIEGLGELALSLPPEDATRQEITALIENQIQTRLLDEQFIEKKLRNGAPVPKNIWPYLGGFQNSTIKTGTRVDDTQHCLSALIKLKKLDGKLK